jgi:hypothetical protein
MEIDINEIREQMKIMLRESVCKVVFTKKDGSTRIMECTLKKELLEQFIPKADPDAPQKKARPQKENQISVYDLNSLSWKSFLVDTVQTIEPIIIKE